MVKLENIDRTVYTRLLTEVFGEDGEYWTKFTATEYTHFEEDNIGRPSFCLVGGLAHLVCGDSGAMYGPKSDCPKLWNYADEITSYVNTHGWHVEDSDYLAGWNDRVAEWSDIKQLLTDLRNKDMVSE